ncbi:PrsW family intramembrane metalloprotease [Prochlorococcus sp. MIT 1300]|uniref:PrsW family intramembrane metalloprotease n=1 Tax=Prochlorococcus sp. MIT 1300 TaxID=3096218 RepID=UPI002A75045C|nr:PrsW family glutamic-type intramembrane protease [Prochlorococcus sp. MIT 1300]
MVDSDSKKKVLNSKVSTNIIVDFIDSLSTIVGGNGLGGFNFKKIIKGINKDHSEEELEASLIVGTKTTTPPIDKISTEYPEPWIFSKLLSGSIILFYGFFLAYTQFDNINLVPGLIITGSFAVPVSTVILFFEINILKNIPLYQVIRLIFFGGLLSLFLALIFFSNTGFLESSLGASIAGIIEEPAKLMALILLARNSKKYPYILNGLLLGASVGCGFAAFESAGYALAFGISDIDSMIRVIQIRGVLSPFAHIAWTAVAGAALWRLQQGNEFSFRLLSRKQFYIPFGVVIFCHAIWNSHSNIPFMGKYIICGFISWILILSFVHLGLEQIEDVKSGKINCL